MYYTPSLCILFTKIFPADQLKGEFFSKMGVGIYCLNQYVINNYGNLQIGNVPRQTEVFPFYSLWKWSLNSWLVP